MAPAAHSASSSSSSSLETPQRDLTTALADVLVDRLDEGAPLLGRKAARLKGRRPDCGTAVNVCNNLIGSGILALPLALAKTSLTCGLALLVGVALLSFYTMWLLCRSCDIAGTFNYKEVVTRNVGPRSGLFVELVMGLYTAGTCIAYGVLIGDFFPEFARFACLRAVGAEGMARSAVCAFATDRRAMVFALGGAVMMPLSSFRDLTPLRYTSFVALAAVVYTCSVTAERYLFETEGEGRRRHEVFHPNTAPDVAWVAPDDYQGLFVALALMGVAFNCHYNIPQFYREIGGSRSRMMASTASGLAMCFVLYCAMAVCGYLHFGGRTEADILNNFSTSDQLAVGARLALGTTIVFSYPLVFNKVRGAADALLFRGEGTRRRHYLLTLLLNVAVILPGAYIEDLSLVLSFNGAIFGSLICYCIPAVVYLCGRHQTWGKAMRGCPGSALPVFCVLFGLAVLGFGTLQSFCAHHAQFGVSDAAARRVCAA